MFVYTKPSRFHWCIPSTTLTALLSNHAQKSVYFLFHYRDLLLFCWPTCWGNFFFFCHYKRPTGVLHQPFSCVWAHPHASDRIHLDVYSGVYAELNKSRVRRRRQRMGRSCLAIAVFLYFITYRAFLDSFWCNCQQVLFYTENGAMFKWYEGVLHKNSVYLPLSHKTRKYRVEIWIK